MDATKPKGFTLIELLITVTVLGIFLALAGPNLFGVLETRKLKGAGENLMADMQFAKAETIKRNAPVILSFVNGASNTWCYGFAVNAACDCTTANSCTIDGIERVVRGVDFDGPSLAAVFSGTLTTETGFNPIRGFAQNLANEGSGGSVTLSQNGKNVIVQLTLNGRARICTTTSTGGYAAC